MTASNDWTDDLKPDERKSWEEFVDRTRRELFPKVEGSSVFVSICPEGEADVKFCVETGAAIKFNKPIIAVAFPGREIPPGLRRVADAVIENVDLETEEGRAKLEEELVPLLERLGR